MNQNAIQQLNNRHYKILEYCLNGLTNKQIAEKLGMGCTQVSIVINSPSFQHELSIRRATVENMRDDSRASAIDDVEAMIKEGAKNAIQRILGGIGSADEGIAIKSSIEILDRAGYPKVNRIESRNLNVVISGEDALRIQQTMILDKVEEDENAET